MNLFCKVKDLKKSGILSWRLFRYCLKQLIYLPLWLCVLTTVVRATGVAVELPTKMRGISTSDKYLQADLFALLAQSEVNVIRLGFSVDSSNASLPTIENPLAPYASNLAILDAALPLARAANIKIILCAAETYGWSREIFKGDAASLATYRGHLVTFWKAMAQRYLNDSVIVAYDILNEPVTDWYSCGQWYANVMPAAVSAIRSVNSNVWLVVESEYQGAPGGFATMPIVNDPRVIYSFHFYSPHSYCNQGILSYPSYTATYPGLNSTWGTAPYTFWDRETLRREMLDVINFKSTYPDKRILVGEFGVLRWAPGGEKWLSDCIELFETYGWDWCNHSPSGWNGYNATYAPAVQTGSDAADGGDRGGRWTTLANGWALNTQEPLSVDIRLGNLVSWTAVNAGSTYQPQWSQNNLTWTDLGTSIVGNSTSTAFHVDGSSFYQVVETAVALSGSQAVLPATSTASLEISWQTESGSNYQVESSIGLGSFTNLGPVVVGDGKRAKLSELRILPSKFYRVGKIKTP